MSQLKSIGGNFFVAIKSFNATIAMSGNFVLNAKNLNVLNNPQGTYKIKRALLALKFFTQEDHKH